MWAVLLIRLTSTRAQYTRTEDALFLLPSQKGMAGRSTEKRKGQTGSQVKRGEQSEQEVNRKEKEVKTGSQENRGQPNQEVKRKDKDRPDRKSGVPTAVVRIRPPSNSTINTDKNTGTQGLTMYTSPVPQQTDISCC